MEEFIRYGGASNIPIYSCNVSQDRYLLVYTGTKFLWSGIANIVAGVFCEIIYILCMYVMSRKEFIHFSCFKLMFVLGMIDIVTIAINCIVHGILLILGSVYCTYPNTIYILGCIGLGAWCATCMCVFILVINRLLDVWKPHLLPVLFDGKKTWIISLIPILYGIAFATFTKPILFNSNLMAWFIDPFLYNEDHYQYTNYPHAINNLLLVALSSVVYVRFYFILTQKYTRYEQAWSKVQYQVFLQAFIVCTLNLFTSFLVIVVYFLPLPPLVGSLIAMICWQLCHCIPPFIYLAVNRTIRKATIRILCSKWPATIEASKNTAYSASQPVQ